MSFGASGAGDDSGGTRAHPRLRSQNRAYVKLSRAYVIQSRRTARHADASPWRAVCPVGYRGAGRVPERENWRVRGRVSAAIIPNGNWTLIGRLIGRLNCTIPPLYQIGYIMRTLLAAALALAFVQAVAAHSWYDYDCCSENDCKPIDAETVKTLPDGYEVTFAGRVFQVPYDDPRIRRSKDLGYHACEYPKEELRCLYAPDDGV